MLMAISFPGIILLGLLGFQLICKSAYQTQPKGQGLGLVTCRNKGKGLVPFIYFLHPYCCTSRNKNREKEAATLGDKKTKRLGKKQCFIFSAITTC